MFRTCLAFGFFSAALALAAPVLAQQEDDAKAISATSGRAHRDGATLTLRAKDRQVRLIDGKCLASSEDHGCSYRLLRYDQDHHVFLVDAVFDLELAVVLWVGDDDGRIVVLPDEPQFSPDGRRFVTVRSCELADGACGLQIWSAAKPRLLWQHQPTEYAEYQFIRWQNSRQIALTATTWIDHKLTSVPATLSADRSGSWHLDGPVERSN